MRTRTTALAAAAGLALAAAPALAKTSHAGWPRIDGVLLIDKADQHAAFSGTPRHDELLGGHGNNVLTGGPAADVLWGDYKPGGQPANQHDVLIGGGGGDYIYASHGYNRILAGRGNDHIFAHFGTGVIDCGPGHDVVRVSRRGRRGWHIRHCETISHRTLGY